jgi:hypothetical protein
MRNLFAAVLSFAALSGFATPAAAQTTTTSPCTQWITSVPYTISQPGYYCLKQNIATSENAAIQIASSDATLDCRGKSLTQERASNDAFAIYTGNDPVRDVTVRSCKIVNFATGIIFGLRSERIQILSNDIVKAQLDGIVLWGSDSKIAGNSVINTHNPWYDYSRNITVTAFEPGVPSSGNSITNNVVAGAYGNGTIWGIRADMTESILINNNQIVDLQPNEGGFAAAINSDGTTAQVIGNVMMSRTGNNYGNLSSSALCTRNIAIGLTTPGFEWCAKSVNNTILP